MHCPYCGKEVANGVVLCANCGKNIRHFTKSLPKQGSSGDVTTILLYITALAPPIGIVAGIISLFKYSNKKYGLAFIFIGLLDLAIMELSKSTMIAPTHNNEVKLALGYIIGLFLSTIIYYTSKGKQKGIYSWRLQNIQAIKKIWSKRKKYQFVGIILIICGSSLLLPAVRGIIYYAKIDKPRIEDEQIISRNLSYNSGILSNYNIYQDGLICSPKLYSFSFNNIASSVQGKSIVKGGYVKIKNTIIEIKGEQYGKWDDYISYGSKENPIKPMSPQSQTVYLIFSMEDLSKNITIETTLEVEYPLRGENNTYYIQTSKFSRKFSLYVVSQEDLKLRDVYFDWENSTNNIVIIALLSLFPFTALLIGIILFIKSLLSHY